LSRNFMGTGSGGDSENGGNFDQNRQHNLSWDDTCFFIFSRLLYDEGSTASRIATGLLGLPFYNLLIRTLPYPGTLGEDNTSRVQQGSGDDNAQAPVQQQPLRINFHRSTLPSYRLPILSIHTQFVPIVSRWPLARILMPPQLNLSDDLKALLREPMANRAAIVPYAPQGLAVVPYGVEPRGAASGPELRWRFYNPEHSVVPYGFDFEADDLARVQRNLILTNAVATSPAAIEWRPDGWDWDGCAEFSQLHLGTIPDGAGPNSSPLVEFRAAPDGWSLVDDFSPAHSKEGVPEGTEIRAKMQEAMEDDDAKPPKAEGGSRSVDTQAVQALVGQSIITRRAGVRVTVKAEPPVENCFRKVM
jgi:hypothetical protein